MMTLTAVAWCSSSRHDFRPDEYYCYSYHYCYPRTESAAGIQYTYYYILHCCYYGIVCRVAVSILVHGHDGDRSKSHDSGLDVQQVEKFVKSQFHPKREEHESQKVPFGVFGAAYVFGRKRPVGHQHRAHAHDARTTAGLQAARD